MTMMTVELPDTLTRELRGLVSGGWYASEDEALREAVRELVARRQRQLQEQHQLEDIAWALKLKLSWEDTCKEMIAAAEDWSAWDGVSTDGIPGQEDWSFLPPPMPHSVPGRKSGNTSST